VLEVGVGHEYVRSKPGGTCCYIHVMVRDVTRSYTLRSSIICALYQALFLFVCFPGVTTHCGCIFHSPVAGFSLLVFEVS
jgi:hypothetical protein